MRPAAKVAMSGICTALSVLLLFFGGVVPVLAYVCPMLTGVLMVVLVRTFGYGTAWVTYVSTGLLSFFLVPDKECMLMYVLFFGYYTIVRQWIGRLRPRSVALAAECLLFNAALAAVNPPAGVGADLCHCFAAGLQGLGLYRRAVWHTGTVDHRPVCSVRHRLLSVLLQGAGQTGHR